MEWIEVKIKTASEAIELITGLLMANNIPNIRIIDDEEMRRFLLDHPLSWDYINESKEPLADVWIIFHVHDDAVGKAIIEHISNELKTLANELHDINFGPLKIEQGPVNDDDWLHEWKKTYKPFTIGEKMVIRPFWEEYTPIGNEVVFTIDPGAVFGTGLHATTQLCCIALEKWCENENTVLDIGCGSGILSVVSLLLGASKAVACDIDPGAARCARENARLNNIDSARYEVYTGGIFDLKKEKYDIVLANIVADVIIELVPTIKEFMKNDGLFIASGIIDTRVDDVKDAIIAVGLQIKEEYNKDDWYCIVSMALKANNHA